MRLGHADGQLAPTLRLEILQLPPGRRRPDHFGGAVNLLRQRQRLFLGGGLQRVGVGDVGAALGGIDDGGGQLFRPGAALGESVALDGGRRPGLHSDAAHGVQFLRAVGGEAVDGDHRRQAEPAHDADMVGQVGAAGRHQLRVGLVQGAAEGAAVPLQGPRRGHQHRRAGQQPALPGFDVHELFEAQIGGETSLGDDIIGVAQGQPVGENGAAAVGDVAERPGVHHRRLPLGGLHQIGQHRLMQQRHQRAIDAQLRHADRLAVSGYAHHHSGDALPQIVRPVGQSQDRHNFRGGNDVEAGLPQRPVALAADAGHHLPQPPVRGVRDPRPVDAAGLEAGDAAAKDGVVHQGGQQIMG